MEITPELRSEIVAMLCHNYSQEQIAEDLHVSVETAQRMVTEVLNYYGVTDKLALQVKFVKAFGGLNGFPDKALKDAERNLLRAASAKAGGKA